MSFCTVVNCMDGRVQLPVIAFLQDYFKAEFVDSITEPGPVRIFDEKTDPTMLKSILARVDISVNHHGSGGIAVCAHPDCAGNPVDENGQKQQIKDSVKYLEKTYPGIKIVGLWVDSKWIVNKI